MSEYGLVHLLLAADAQRLSGTLQLLGCGAAASGGRHLVLEVGQVVAGDFGDRGLGLLPELLPLCARVQGAYRFVVGEDLLGSGRDVLRGRVDAYMLAAVASRGLTPHARGWAELKTLGDVPLRVAPERSLSRFGLTRDEWNFVQDVRRNPGTLNDVLSRGLLDPAVARRLTMLLLLTGVLEVAAQAANHAYSSADEQRATNRQREPLLAHSMPVMRRISGVQEVASADGLRELLAYGECHDGQDAPFTHPPPLLVPGADVDGRWFEAERRLRHAEALARRHQLTDALVHVDAALSLDPLAVEALVLKGYVLWRLSPDPLQPDPAALEMVDRALRIDEDCERAHQVRAQLLRATGREEEAFSHFARSSSPEDLSDLSQVTQQGDRQRRTSNESFWRRLRRSIPPFRRVG